MGKYLKNFKSKITDNLLRAAFIQNDISFLINFNKDKYTKELNIFYEFHKKENHNEISKLLNKTSWEESQDI